MSSSVKELLAQFSGGGGTIPVEAQNEQMKYQEEMEKRARKLALNTQHSLRTIRAMAKMQYTDSNGDLIRSAKRRSIVSMEARGHQVNKKSSGVLSFLGTQSIRSFASSSRRASTKTSIRGSVRTNTRASMVEGETAQSATRLSQQKVPESDGQKLVRNLMGIDLFGGEASAALRIMDSLERHIEEHGPLSIDEPTGLALLQVFFPIDFSFDEILPVQIRGLNLASQLDNIVVLSNVAAVWNSLLTMDDAPVALILSTGLLPRMSNLLRKDELSFGAKLDMVSGIANIAGGSRQDTNAVVESGAIEPLMDLMNNKHWSLRDECVFALGNIAGDSTQLRDSLLESGILEKVQVLLTDLGITPSPPRSTRSRIVDRKHISSSGASLVNALRQSVGRLSGRSSVASIRALQQTNLLRNIAWLLSNLFRGFPDPDIEYKRLGVALAAMLVRHQDSQVVREGCLVFNFVCVSGAPEATQLVKDAGVLGDLVNLVKSADEEVIYPLLRMFRKCCTGPGAFELGREYTENLRRRWPNASHPIRIEIVRTINSLVMESTDKALNILVQTPGIKKFIQELFTDTLPEERSQAQLHSTTDLRIEVLTTLGNATRTQEYQVIEALFNIDSLRVLEWGLNTDNAYTRLRVIDSVQNILIAGRRGRCICNDFLPQLVQRTDFIKKVYKQMDRAARPLFNHEVPSGIEWRLSTHLAFPPHFRRAVSTLLLLEKRAGILIQNPALLEQGGLGEKEKNALRAMAKIPKEVFLYTLTFCQPYWFCHSSKLVFEI